LSMPRDKPSRQINESSFPMHSGFGRVDFLSGRRNFRPQTLEELKSCTPGRGPVPAISEKIIVIGETNVGKSCLVRRFCENVFEEHYKPTIGIDFFVRKYEVFDVPFDLNIWDTAGQEVFRSVSQAYYRGASAAVIVFSMYDPKTLAAVSYWADEVKSGNPEGIPLFLVGSKSDMPHVVSAGSIISACQELGAECFQVSAKTKQGVDELFDRVMAVAVDWHMNKLQAERVLSVSASPAQSAAERAKGREKRTPVVDLSDKKQPDSSKQVGAQARGGPCGMSCGR